MSDERRNHKKTQHRLKRKLKQQTLRREQTARTKVSLVKPDLNREVRRITQLAQAGDSRIVTVGKLVLFSTRSRDAWLLNPEDGFAACLCRDGKPQPVHIIDTPAAFAIDWPAKFTVDGELLNVLERSGSMVAITSYPTVELAAACRAVVGNTARGM